jgi:hypothetical protein
MEFTEMGELLRQLEQLVAEMQRQIDAFDETLRGEVEILRSQIDNLRN